MKTLIAGPCSAESYEQLETIAKQFKEKEIDIKYFRAGVWKPRTNPGTFEGMGEDALKWLKKLKNNYNLKICTEVASKEHVRLAFLYDVDALWIGARTTSNPFLVQEIAEAIAENNKDITVMIKNPMHPELSLWVGAFNRFENMGINNLKAIHRGFKLYNGGKYRNEPLWQQVVDFKLARPETEIIVDPSHISGNRKLVKEVVQLATNFDIQSFMVETHNNPDSALSDASQQVTPTFLKELVTHVKNKQTKKLSLDQQYEKLISCERSKIQTLDRLLLDILNQRMNVSKNIGEIKKDYNVTIFQKEYFNTLLNTQKENAKQLGLDENFTDELMKLIHTYSVKVQNEK